MAKNRILQNIKLAPALSPAASVSAGTIEGIIIDRIAYQTITFGLTNGTASGTPDSQAISFKIQHGKLANGSDMADVDATQYVDANGSSATLPVLVADNTNVQIGVIAEGLNKYIRLVATVAFVAGTSPKQFLSGYAVLGDGNNEPVA